MMMNRVGAEGGAKRQAITSKPQILRLCVPHRFSTTAGDTNCREPGPRQPPSWALISPLSSSSALCRARTFWSLHFCIETGRTRAKEARTHNTKTRILPLLSHIPPHTHTQIKEGHIHDAVFTLPSSPPCALPRLRGRASRRVHGREHHVRCVWTCHRPTPS